jgi:hypothetical protein
MTATVFGFACMLVAAFIMVYLVKLLIRSALYWSGYALTSRSELWASIGTAILSIILALIMTDAMIGGF